MGSGIVLRPRGRPLPAAIFWVTCFAVVPLGSFGTAFLMVYLNGGQPISAPWVTIFRLVGIFFEFPATPVISGLLARRQGFGWLRVVMVAIGAFLALIAWISLIYSVLTAAGVQMFPPDG